MLYFDDKDYNFHEGGAGASPRGKKNYILWSQSVSGQLISPFKKYDSMTLPLRWHCNSMTLPIKCPKIL